MTRATYSREPPTPAKPASVFRVQVLRVLPERTVSEPPVPNSCRERDMGRRGRGSKRKKEIYKERGGKPPTPAEPAFGLRFFIT
jgi:hypothetical protein